MNINDYIEISLCISGKVLLPDNVSEKLKMTPTSTKTIDEFIDSVPDEIKTNEWCYTIKKYSCTALSFAFDELIELFENKTDCILNIVETYKANASIVIVANMINDELPELLISSNEVSFSNKIKAEISLDIYRC